MLVEKTLQMRPLGERGCFSGWFVKYEGVIAALSYALSSMSIIIFNKTVFATFGFKSPIVVCLAHMAICFTLVVILKVVGAVDYRDFEFGKLRKMVPLAVCSVGNILLGLTGTKLLSVPMFTTLRRTTILFIIISTYFRSGNCPSIGVAFSVFLLIFGAVVAGYNDLYFDPLSYSIVVLNNVLTAGSLQITKAVEKEVSKFGIVFYNSMISMPMLLVLSLYFDELTYVAHFEKLNNLFFQIFFLSGGFMAFALNVTTAWCTQATSPLTTCITGQTKNIVTTVLGALLFVDFAYNHLIALGIGISVSGSIFYAYIKYREGLKL
jgi:hypothetical protein